MKSMNKRTRKKEMQEQYRVPLEVLVITTKEKREANPKSEAE